MKVVTYLEANRSLTDYENKVLFWYVLVVTTFNNIYLYVYITISTHVYIKDEELLLKSKHVMVMPIQERHLGRVQSKNQCFEQVQVQPYSKT